MSSPRSTGTEDLGNFLATRGLLVTPPRTPPRSRSRSRSPPRLRRSARLAARRGSRSRSRSRSPVPAFPTALRGMMVPVDLRPRGSPIIDLVSVSSSPRTPKHIRTILNELKELENQFPGIPKLWEIREGRLLEFMGALRDRRLTEGEKKALYNEFTKMLERLWRGNHLTTKQYQKLVHRP
jgi:hypothetical protein